MSLALDFLDQHNVCAHPPGMINSEDHFLVFFCCVSADSRNLIFCTWTENQAGRGSTEVASLLINFLGSPRYDGTSTVRLFCDGCAGQNKHSHIVNALYFWLRLKSSIHITEIQLIFPKWESLKSPGECFKLKIFLSTLKKDERHLNYEKNISEKIKMCCVFERILKSGSIDLDASFTELTLHRGIQGTRIRQEMRGCSKAAMVQKV
nr:unnamed protein product [Callosobruchus analis]